MWTLPYCYRTPLKKLNFKQKKHVTFGSCGWMVSERSTLDGSKTINQSEKKKNEGAYF